MTPFEERDAQIAALIRRRIAKLAHQMRDMGACAQSTELAARIKGLRDALAFIDPNPYT